MSGNRIVLTFLASAGLAVASPSATVAGESPSFTGIGDFPGGEFYSYAHGISADGGVVVGWSEVNGTSTPRRAFRWSETGGMEDFGDMNDDGFNSSARVVSSDGSVIAGVAAIGPFRWTAENGMVNLNENAPAGFVAHGPLGISADGSVIAGTGSTGSSLVGFRWTPQTGVEPIGALPGTITDSFASGVSADGTVITGQSMFGESFEVQPIRWTEETGMVGLGDVPGGVFYALGMAISADGKTIIGDAIGPLNGLEAFRWTAQTGLAQLDPAVSFLFHSTAKDASGDGSVIVGFADTGAMVWDETHLMRNLQAVLTTEFGLDLTGWTLLVATAISDDARSITGNGWNPNGDYEAWVARLASPTVPGDMNGDGILTPDDIPGFVDVLTESDRDFVHAIIADMNADGLANGADIIALLQALVD